jgi:glycosyltransferase involved in cell wall biosynthesis
MVSKRFPEKTNYIPHAVPSDLYEPISKEESSKFKTALLGKDRSDHFTALFVSRNARRKMPSDILVSWKMFLEELEKKYGHRNATFLMHADPLDPEGANLYSVLDTLDIKDNVVFSKERIGFNEMKLLYNVCDTIVNRSCNEGFGLGTLEAMMCGKPIIALKTGGLTRQVENPETGEQYGIALEPEVKCLVGNQMVPYIYEDFVSHKTLADAFMKMYEMGPEERQRIGARAAERVRKDYNLQNVVEDWDKTLTKTIEDWKNPEYDRGSWKVVEL